MNAFRLFIDTAPVIYFLDNDPRYAEKVKYILDEAITKGTEIITSAITVAEYLIYPYRTGKIEKADIFFNFIRDIGILIVPIDTVTADKAARIRAEYKFFKTMDALQLASACIYGCDVFLTNDKQLCQFREIRCVTLEE